MGRTQHFITAPLAAAIALYCVGRPESVAPVGAILAGAVLGVNAPDWLEVTRPPIWVAARHGGGYWRRQSILPHRTITHWWPLWMLLSMGLMGWWHWRPDWPLAGSLSLDIRSGCVAFLAGGWVHLLCDLPNPSGLPGACHPMSNKRRSSLRLWRSNSFWPNTIFAIVLAAIAVGMIAWLYGWLNTPFTSIHH